MMKKQNLSLILTTVAAIASVTVFALLKINLFDTKSNAHSYERETDKIDSTVLPCGVGFNPLKEKSFGMAGENYSIAWKFLDEGNVVLEERFPLDNLISLTIKWNGKYSFNSETNVLSLKRVSLVTDGNGGDEKVIEGSVKIYKTIEDDCIQKINDKFDSINLPGNIKLENLLGLRIKNYVERELYEIENFQIDIFDSGLLFEDLNNDLSILSQTLVFKNEDSSKLLTIDGGAFLLDFGLDEKNRLLGGLLREKENLWTTTLYEFSRDRESRTLSLEKLGDFDFEIHESTEVSDFQTVDLEMKILKSPEQLDFGENEKYVAKKILHPSLIWMNGE